MRSSTIQFQREVSEDQVLELGDQCWRDDNVECQAVIDDKQRMCFNYSEGSDHSGTPLICCEETSLIMLAAFPRLREVEIELNMESLVYVMVWPISTTLQCFCVLGQNCSQTKLQCNPTVCFLQSESHWETCQISSVSKGSEGIGAPSWLLHHCVWSTTHHW